MARTCAICGWRDSIRTTVVEGRIGRVVWACESCLAAPAEPPMVMHHGDPIPEATGDERSIAWRTIDYARRNPGCNCTDIGRALGMPDDYIGRNGVSCGLSRGVRMGVLKRVTVYRKGCIYYPTSMEWNVAPRRSAGPSRKRAA